MYTDCCIGHEAMQWRTSQYRAPDTAGGNSGTAIGELVEVDTIEEAKLDNADKEVITDLHTSADLIQTLQCVVVGPRWSL